MKRLVRVAKVICGASVGAVLAATYCCPAPYAASTDGTFPPPGTYRLDKIQRVPFAQVLDDNNTLNSLSDYTEGSITLLTFFYSYCSDPNGCPVAWDAYEKAREKIAHDLELQRKVRLVFFSFDPVHDIPAVLHYFANQYKSDIVPWRFLSSRSQESLKLVLDSFGQEVSIERDANNEPTFVLNHLLKVFLIDRNGWVREIYTTAFLDPRVVLNDIRTLLMEERGN